MNKRKNQIATVSGIPVNCTSFEFVLKSINDSITKKLNGRYISITNTESMYHATRIEQHKTYIQNADFSLCDGIGSVIAGYAWGHDVPRLNGPILMLKACEYGQEHGWRHFFYGGNVGVADTMVQSLKQKYPDLISVGTYCPPFRPLTPEEDSEVIDIINDANPDIVWVGLGLLKQEKWIAEHIKRINVPWMCGVGAAFDYHSGEVPWAPDWVQKMGMEWLFRTIIQPKQRLKRYYWSFDFMFKSIFDSLKYKNRRNYNQR